MRSEKDTKYIYAPEHKLHYYYYHYSVLEGIEKIKSEKEKKMTTKQSENFFFTDNMYKHCNGVPIFIDCLHRTII